MFRFLVRFSGNFLFFGAPVFVLLLGAVMLSMEPIYGPIDTNEIDRATLIRIMQLRDFRRMPPDRVTALTDRAEREFGRNGVMKPVFDFSETEKKIYAYFQGKETETKSFFETNLYLMARTRYFRWMNEYEKSDEAARTALMKEVTADMKYWEEIYMDFLRAAELPIPPLAELIRQFDEMIEGFKAGAAPEEIVRIDAFKQRMNAAIVMGEVQGAVKNLSGNVSSAVSNVFGTFLPSAKKKENAETRKKRETGDEP